MCNATTNQKRHAGPGKSRLSHWLARAWAAREAWGLYLLFAVFLACVPRFANLWDIDFRKAYYPVGRSVLETGTFAYTYEGFKNLPIVSLLLAPFALGNMPTMRRVFLCFELVSYLAAFVVFIRSFTRTRSERWLALLLFAACRPFYICLAFGQLTPFAWLILLGTIAAYHLGKYRRTGVLLGLAFLLKIPAGLLFFYFLRKKAYRVVIVSMATFLLFMLASILMFGFDLHMDYYREVIQANSGSTLLAYNNQNVYAFIVRYLHPPAFDDWSMVAVPKALFYAVTLSWLACLAWLLARVSTCRRGADAYTTIDFASLICLLLMVFPVSWDHYYLFLIFPFFVAYRHIRRRPNWAHGGLWLLSLVLLNSPERFLRAPNVMIPWVRLTTVSTPFIACLILLALLVRLRQQFRACTPG